MLSIDILNAYTVNWALVNGPFSHKIRFNSIEIETKTFPNFKS